MLGLKLNHFSKRGHSKHGDYIDRRLQTPSRMSDEKVCHEHGRITVYPQSSMHMFHAFAGHQSYIHQWYKPVTISKQLRLYRQCYKYISYLDIGKCKTQKVRILKHDSLQHMLRKSREIHMNSSYNSIYYPPPKKNKKKKKKKKKHYKLVTAVF